MLAHVLARGGEPEKTDPRLRVETDSGLDLVT